jgi:hypothetical protein
MGQLEPFPFKIPVVQIFSAQEDGGDESRVKRK